ncbi:hypothetical protein QJQ45_007753 [Haematococcus lacustris]|nr:hypothetical protein QJQ45_007753 [Haematococcus lacustris]
MYRNTVAKKMPGTKPTDKKIKAAAPRTADSGHESDELPLAQRPRGQPLEPFASSDDEGERVGEEEELEDEGEGEEGEDEGGEDEGEEDEGEEGEGADEEEMEGEEEEEEEEKQKQRPAKKRARKGGKQVPDEFSKIILAQYKHHAPNADKPFSVLGKYEYTIPGCVPGEYPKLGSNSVEARWNVPMRAIIGLVWKEFTKANPAYLALLSYWMLLAAFKKRLKWDTYFAFFNNHFMGIHEASPPEGLKPFASLWGVYKRGTAAGGQQHQHQQQDLRQVTEEEQQQPGGEGAGPSSSKRPRTAEDQALIQCLIQKVDTVQDTVNRLESSTGGTLLHGGAVRFPKNTQLPQLAIDMAAVVAASILITRVYNHMVFSSVNANSKTQYGTGQRVQVVLAKSDKNSSGDLDTTLTLLTDKYNAAVYSALTEEKKKEVDEAKTVLTRYLTLLQPVLRQLLGRPLNALASIITDPTWQRRLTRTGKMVTTLAEQLAQAQAPHTDFLPVGPGMDDGLVFLLALQDFPLVAYMGSHKLSRLAAAHCRRTADGQKQVVEVEDMDALALTLPHQLGTEVLVKAGQLVLFRGNTVHAGNVGVAGSCCARLYGFGRPDTVADNTTMNTSELGDLYHGLFQPIQDEGIGPKMADWNRRGMAGQWDPVDKDSAVWSQDPVGVQQDPVVWCQDPVVPGPCGEGPGPCGARTLWTLWCQDPVVWCLNPVGQDPVAVRQDPDPVAVRQNPVTYDFVVWCQDPVMRCQDPVVSGPCGVVPGPCGPGPCGECQDPVDPVGQDPVVWCQDPVDPVVRCQDPVGQDPVGVQQDPVDPVVRCQDPVSQNPVVCCQDPVEKDTHRRTLYRVLAHMVKSIQTGST